jgi:hypothetical protein
VNENAADTAGAKDNLRDLDTSAPERSLFHVVFPPQFVSNPDRTESPRT